MIYIILAIVISVFLLGVFKLFDKYKVNTFHAIVTNYLAAALTGFFFSQHKIDFNLITETSWLYVCIPLGFLFISVFYLISLTAQKISIAAASVANKMSVVMPVIAAFILYNDKVTALKIVAIVLALASVYLTTKSENKGGKANKSLLFLPVLVFIGSGIIDTLVNYTNKKLIHSPKDDALFTGFGFYIAGCIGVLILTYIVIVKKEKLVFRSLIGGLALGIPNFLSIYFILKALSSGAMESSQLYPVANVFIVILSALAGVVLFKDRLSKINAIGILLSVVAIALIMI